MRNKVKFFKRESCLSITSSTLRNGTLLMWQNIHRFCLWRFDRASTSVLPLTNLRMTPSPSRLKLILSYITPRFLIVGVMPFRTKIPPFSYKVEKRVRQDFFVKVRRHWKCQRRSLKSGKRVDRQSVSAVTNVESFFRIIWFSCYDVYFRRHYKIMY